MSISNNNPPSFTDAGNMCHDEWKKQLEEQSRKHPNSFSPQVAPKDDPEADRLWKEVERLDSSIHENSSKRDYDRYEKAVEEAHAHDRKKSAEFTAKLDESDKQWRIQYYEKSLSEITGYIADPKMDKSSREIHEQNKERIRRELKELRGY